MQPSIDLFILPLLGLGLIALILVIRLVVVAIRRKAWSGLAERAGLSFAPGNFFGRGMSVSGLYRSGPLRMEPFVFRSGRSSSTYTRITLPTPGAPSDFFLLINTEGIFSRLGKLLGMKDIQTGDEDLDRRFLIRGKPEADVVRLLRSASLRPALLAAPSFQLRLENGQVDLQKQGVVVQHKALLALLDLAVSLAGEVDEMKAY